MDDRDLPLQRFPGPGGLPDLKINSGMQRRDSRLEIRFQVRGSLEEVSIPGAAALPGRRHGLWKETCFEFFLAVKGSPGYWEFNLSPAGHWNVYRFSAYRQGMTEENAFTALPFCVQRQAAALQLTLKIEMDGIVRGDQSLDAALAAVVKPREGAATYWALAHCGSQPDFHQREGFIIDL